MNTHNDSYGDLIETAQFNAFVYSNNELGYKSLEPLKLLIPHLVDISFNNLSIVNLKQMGSTINKHKESCFLSDPSRIQNKFNTMIVDTFSPRSSASVTQEK
jgi:hypothetical protein